MHAISEKRLSANRANAQKSTGPVSIDGKTKCAQNARRHGVTAQTTVMTEEDRIRHDDFCATMMAELAPVGAIETFLASSVSEEAWRLNHSRAQCNNIVAIGHFDTTADRFTNDHPEIQTAITTAAVVRDYAKTLELLSLYEQRIHRSFQKHFDQLRELQAERKAKCDRELEEARLLFQLAELRDLPFVPASDGFVFSKPEIVAYTERFHKLHLAKNENLNYKTLVNLVELPDVSGEDADDND